MLLVQVYQVHKIRLFFFTVFFSKVHHIFSHTISFFSPIILTDEHIKLSLHVMGLSHCSVSLSVCLHMKIITHTPVYARIRYVYDQVRYV